MRKVITGDQVAQIYNRDPLAFPVWRAPVYRTPGWIIAIAQLCRFSWWLARLVFRHPVVSLVSGGARVHLVGNRLARRDPPGRSGRCWCLVCWRVVWPVSFARRVSCSGA